MGSLVTSSVCNPRSPEAVTSFRAKSLSSMDRLFIERPASGRMSKGSLPQWKAPTLVAVLLISTMGQLVLLASPGPSHFDLTVARGATSEVGGKAVQATAPGTLRVTSSPSGARVTLADAASTYRVLLFEQGIPASINWTTTVTNNVTGVQTTINNGHNPHVYNIPNGTYTYHVSSDNASFAPVIPSGGFTVNGTGLNLTSVFDPAYAVTLYEADLPTSTGWSASVKNSTGITTTQSTHLDLLVFYERNGTYTFHVPSDIAGFMIINPAGEFAVNGSSLNRTITFAQLFHITLIAIGLPPATGWNATVGNSTSNISSSSLRADLYFLEPNGTFWIHAVPYLANFAQANASQQFLVNGSDESVNVTFSQLGLSSGGGIPFTTWFPVTVAVVAIGTLILGVVLAVRRRRAKPPAPPPKPWDESSP